MTLESLIEVVPLFSRLSEKERDEIIRRLRRQEHDQGTVICTTGLPVDEMYLLESGSVELSTDEGAIIGSVGAGGLLGDVDLLLGRSRSVEARARSDVLLWILRDRDLSELVGKHPSLGVRLSLAFGAPIAQFRPSLVERRLKPLSLLANLSLEALTAVVNVLEIKEFPQGEFLFRSGTPAEMMFILESGRVSLLPTAAKVKEVGDELKEGATLGQMEVIMGGSYAATAQALTDVIVWTLSRKALQELTTKYPTLNANRDQLVQDYLSSREETPSIKGLRRLSLFADLPDEALQEVAERLLLRQASPGEEIFVKWSPTDALHLIESGQVEVGARLEGDDVFGDKALLMPKKREMTVRAVTEVKLWMLRRSDLDQLALRYPSVGVALHKLLSQSLTSVARFESVPRVKEAIAEEKAPPQPEARPVPSPAPARPEARPAPPPAHPQPEARPAPPPSRPRPSRRRAFGLAETVQNVTQGVKESVLGTALWLVSLSTGGKLRLLLMLLLLVWLCGIAIPATLFTVWSDERGWAALFPWREAKPPLTLQPTLGLSPSQLITPTSMTSPVVEATMSPTEGEILEPTDTSLVTGAPSPVATPTSAATLVMPMRARITGDGLQMRVGPGAAYEVAASLSEGDEVDVLGRDEMGDWVKVVLGGGEEGWVASEFVDVGDELKMVPVLPPEPIEAPTRELSPTVMPSPTVPSEATAAPTPVPEITVPILSSTTGGGLRMRSGPATDYRVVLLLAEGQEVSVLGRDETGEWLKISLDSGEEGWVAAEFIDLGVDVEALPIEVP
jgi:CRP-like cAMP-binding protein/uncharacterized protein YraI